MPPTDRLSPMPFASKGLPPVRRSPAMRWQSSAKSRRRSCGNRSLRAPFVTSHCPAGATLPIACRCRQLGQPPSPTHGGSRARRYPKRRCSPERWTCWASRAVHWARSYPPTLKQRQIKSRSRRYSERLTKPEQIVAADGLAGENLAVPLRFSDEEFEIAVGIGDFHAQDPA